MLQVLWIWKQNAGHNPSIVYINLFLRCHNHVDASDWNSGENYLFLSAAQARPGRGKHIVLLVAAGTIFWSPMHRLLGCEKRKLCHKMGGPIFSKLGSWKVLLAVHTTWFVKILLHSTPQISESISFLSLSAWDKTTKRRRKIRHSHPWFMSVECAAYSFPQTSKQYCSIFSWTATYFWYLEKRVIEFFCYSLPSYNPDNMGSGELYLVFIPPLRKRVHKRTQLAYNVAPLLHAEGETECFESIYQREGAP